MSLPPFAHFSGASMFPPTSMHLIVSGLVLPPQQQRLDFRHGSSRHWVGGRVTASPFILELHLLLFRRFLTYWQPQTTQDKGFGTLSKDVVSLISIILVV